MKKFLKFGAVFVLIICIVFNLTACGSKTSETTVDTSAVKAVNGVSTNGGMTVVHGDYLYYINGAKDVSDTTLSKNKRGAICRVKYDPATGKTTGDSEVVVDSLVGFSYGSLNFFGDYMYYTTPCSGKNNKGTTLYNKVEFKRYDLVNDKNQTLYTTTLNSSDESITFGYYVVGNELHLVVYEKSAETITSLKIGTDVETNYVLKEVKSCVLSENYGKVVTDNATFDANSFVFYTKNHKASVDEGFDEIQTGVKVYRVSPNKDNSKCIADNGQSISLQTIRCGKLIYSCNSKIYYQLITGADNETLSLDFGQIISYDSLDNVIYLENYAIEYETITGGRKQAKLVESKGNIILLYYADTNYEIVLLDWKDGKTIQSEVVTELSKPTSFTFIGTTVLTEIDEEDETKIEKVFYLLYTDSNIVYKLEFARLGVSDTDFKISYYANQIKLSTTTMNETKTLLAPEIVGSYLFMQAQDSSKNTYMYQIDLTITKTSTESATKISLDE